MIQFFQDIFSEAFLLRSVIAMALAAVACGIVGCYVVLKRDSYAVGAVSHSLLGGVGAALFFGTKYSLPWLTPWLGALIAALIVAVLLTLMTVRWKLRTDTALSAVWAIGMAIGISFVTAMPGYAQDLNSYLFSSILIISRQDLLTAVVLDIFVIVLTLLWHQRFVALTFHREILTLRGVSTTCVQLAFQLMVAFTVVILSQLVGIVLCMALLILPVAAASALSRRIPAIMLLSGIICFACAFLGVGLAYNAPHGTFFSASGANIIELAGIVYLLASAIRFLQKRPWRKLPKRPVDDCTTCPKCHECHAGHHHHHSGCTEEGAQ